MRFELTNFFDGVFGNLSTLSSAGGDNFFSEFNSIPDFPFPPDDVAVVVPSARRRIGDRCHDRVRLATDYSGLETPSMALRYLGYRADLVAACDAKAELRRYLTIANHLLQPATATSR